MQNLHAVLSEKTSLKQEHIKNILDLLDNGATIPFIARYRKELTGGADDSTLRDFEALYESAKKLLLRKEEVLRLIKERSRVTQELEELLNKAQTLQQVEDIFRPFKEKKNTRGGLAIAKGLSGLAKILQSASITKEAFEKEAQKYVKKGLTLAQAVSGAQDIVAQHYADLPREREAIRNSMLRYGLLEVKKAKEFDANSHFSSFVGKSEKVATIPSHRYLGIMRGVNEKQLSVKISIDMQRVYNNIEQYRVPCNAKSSKELLLSAYKDGLKRLLLPSVEREVHALLKERSDTAAIKTFGRNLCELLLTPPITQRVILGVDPAFRSGCKLAVIDENGKYLEHAVIFPTQPRQEYEKSKKTVLDLVQKYKVEVVAIGNGTASRETSEFFARLNAEAKTKEQRISYTVVSEAGASVYSASKIAAQEYPDLDVTIRGAISIAQRLRDPMAALVKIDPKSLGIGQYQHDVDQKLLEKKLEDVTTDLVNRVGVDLNSASFSLLAFVAGIGEAIAKSIVAYREKNGAFTAKSQLLKVKGLGAKAFEQSAGFLRIKDADNLLDNTGVHPESYEVATHILKLHNKEVDFASLAEQYGLSEQTLKDILKELQKPGFDPRSELPVTPFKEGVVDLESLSAGSFVSGVVRNITDFGAFVDIGLKNDGMIHISKMSKSRISHPLELLSLNQYLPNIEVLSIDKEKQKIALSLV